MNNYSPKLCLCLSRWGCEGYLHTQSWHTSALEHGEAFNLEKWKGWEIPSCRTTSSFTWGICDNFLNYYKVSNGHVDHWQVYGRVQWMIMINQQQTGAIEWENPQCHLKFSNRSEINIWPYNISTGKLSLKCARISFFLWSFTSGSYIE